MSEEKTEKSIETRLETATAIACNAVYGLRDGDGREESAQYYSDMEDICAWKAFLLIQEGLNPFNIQLMMEVYGPAQLALRG